METPILNEEIKTEIQEHLDKDLKAIYAKFCKGDPINDKELAFITKKVKQTIEVLDAFDPDHRASRNELQRNLTTLEGYAYWRRRK